MKFNGIPKWFMETKAGKEAQAEAQEKVRTERQEAVLVIEHAASSVAPRLEELDRAIPGLRQELESARLRLSDAKNRLDAAENEARGLRMGRDYQVSRLKKFLAETCPQEILEFQDWCRSEWHTTRHTPFTSKAYAKNFDNGRYAEVNNQPSILARMDALKAAIQAAEELKTDASADEDIGIRLEELRATIPPILSPEHFLPEGAKPAPLPGPDPDQPGERRSWALNGGALR